VKLKDKTTDVGTESVTTLESLHNITMKTVINC